MESPHKPQKPTCVCVCVRERERECSSFLVCWSRSSLHIRWIIFPRCWVTVKLNILEPIYSIRSSESRTGILTANFSSSKASSMKEPRQKMIDLARQYTPFVCVCGDFMSLSSIVPEKTVKILSQHGLRSHKEDELRHVSTHSLLLPHSSNPSILHH